MESPMRVPLAWAASLLLSAFLLSTSACATHKIDTGTDVVGAGGDDAAVLAAADELWAQRSDRAQLEAAIAKYEEAYRIDPKDLAVLTRLTRATYFLADAFIEDPDAKGEMFHVSIAWGDKALGTNAGFAETIAAGKKVANAVQHLTAVEAEALYWRSSALGKWASAQGFGTILKYKNEIFDSMTTVTALDSELYFNGPDRYWGAYYARAPAFAGGDMDKSKEHFDKSIEGSPEFLGTYVLYAEYYATKAQKKDLFEELLNKVMAADPTLIEEIEPEQRQEQKKAAKLLEQVGERFID
jgi:tetratricopeptide (TPR) repeat protein